jgi:hypothetical protein
MLAMRFVGGNRTPGASKDFTGRDGYGARVLVELGDGKLTREHRCGDGWSTQNSATMILGIGARTTVPLVSVRWPSGKISSTKDVPSGTLLTVYENPAEAPAGQAFTRSAYHAKMEDLSSRLPTSDTEEKVTVKDRPAFSITNMDTRAKTGARLRIYTSFATTSELCKAQLPLQQMLKDELGKEGVDIAVVPIDETDDNNKLGTFARDYRPAARLVNLPQTSRKEAAAAFARTLGGEPAVPSTVVTDSAGRIVAAQPGLPTVSSLRKMLSEPGR